MWMHTNLWWLEKSDRIDRKQGLPSHQRSARSHRKCHWRCKVHWCIICILPYFAYPILSLCWKVWIFWAVEAEDHQHSCHFSFCSVSELETAETVCIFNHFRFVGVGLQNIWNWGCLRPFAAGAFLNFRGCLWDVFANAVATCLGHGIQLSSRDVCWMFDPRSETKQDVVITGAIPRVPHWEPLSFCQHTWSWTCWQKVVQCFLSCLRHTTHPHTQARSTVHTRT